MTNEEWLKGMCNRYINGICETVGCLRRGGYKPGSFPVDCNVATCHAHETLQELATNEEKSHAENVTCQKCNRFASVCICDDEPGTEIAACALITASNFVRDGNLVGAYMEAEGA